MRQNLRHPALSAERLATRRRLIAQGKDPYPPAVRPTHTLGQLHHLYRRLPADTATGEFAVLVGRVMAHRAHGGMGFADLVDAGAGIQLILTDDASQAPRLYAGWQADVDLGDQVSVTGEIVTSRTGALSVRVTGWELAAKALRPPPGTARPRRDSTWASGAGRRDQLPPAQRMMLDRQEMTRAKGRAAVLRAVRGVLDSAAYLEADTPLLHALPGGTARPFRTWMNAWQVPLYLRGTTELYLKRLIVGGAERVFELGRLFRNEGTGAMHHPEFTVCEGYAAYTGYRDSADTVERLVRAAAAALHETEGATGITSAILHGSAAWPDRSTSAAAHGDTGNPADPDGGPGGPNNPHNPHSTGGTIPPAPFARIDLHQLLSEYLKEPVTSATSRETFLRHARRHGLDAPDDATAPALALLLFRKVVRPTLTEPTFVFDFPSDAARFARPRAGHPTLVEAWSLILAGTDIGQGCTELTDPVEQRRRLTEQQSEPGLEHLTLDEDFLATLEYGLPPLGGFSLGVDRLIGALRDDGRRFSDHLCLPLERAVTGERIGSDAPPADGLSREPAVQE
ncbi:lysyl-tRNA synthetase, class 2 [Streptomyces sp. yr375]|uniref:amino acid--tRNA ligase-related protein n=1 Tax=Streptomyces sp. yr375 TaxID=1761906 RepID=UPI0008B0EF81|nr:amino acid--tRNA ligase-related protein [Streptomyces sp. yr375]SER74491.1 lysyl-tRNA synthetase, class 2 [Streptomyces sp. yr375]